MKFNKRSRTLELEAKDCNYCGRNAQPGTMAGRKTCDTCNGTGRGPRGKIRGCRDCFDGSVPDFVNVVPCSLCGGNYKNFSMETFCDTAPLAAIRELPISIVRADRGNSFNENYLGVGTLWSCTDYGSRWGGDDSELLSEVWEQLGEDRVQAMKIVLPYERGAKVAKLATKLVITVTRDGYAVRAVSTQKVG